MSSLHPKVSVVITTYKRPEMLSRAIKSVLSQTYRNLEIIVVDDNPPDSVYRDKTCLCMTEFSDRNNVRYLKQEKNTGACNARNAGAQIATGKYLNFLDDDDEFLPTKLEKQVQLMESLNDEIGVCGSYYYLVDDEHGASRVIKIHSRGNVFFNQLCSCIVSTSVPLFNRTLFLKSGGWEKMHSSQDHWLLAKVFSINPNFDFVQEPLIKIHYHKQERISTNSTKPLGAIELAEKMKQYYPLLSPSQIKTLEVNMLDNILLSYSLVYDRKQYLKYALKRFSMDFCIGEKNIMHLSRCIFGFRFTEKIRNIYLHLKSDLKGHAYDEL